MGKRRVAEARKQGEVHGYLYERVKGRQDQTRGLKGVRELTQGQVRKNKASESGGQRNQDREETTGGFLKLGSDPGEGCMSTVPEKEARQVLGHWA